MIDIERLRSRTENFDVCNLTAEELRLLLDVYEAASAWRDDPWRDRTAADRLVRTIDAARRSP